MAADFWVFIRCKQCRVIVSKRQTCNLSERIENDIAVDIDDVVSSALVEIDDDLRGADVLHLVHVFHCLSGNRARP